MKRVFVCSPYRATAYHSVKSNVKIARLICQWMVEDGDIPFAPHLFYPQFMDDGDPEQRELGISFSKNWLATCDYMIVWSPWIESGRRQEPSEGMTQEIKWAKEMGKEIVYLDQHRKVTSPA